MGRICLGIFLFWAVHASLHAHACGVHFQKNADVWEMEVVLTREMFSQNLSELGDRPEVSPSYFRLTDLEPPSYLQMFYRWDIGAMAKDLSADYPQFSWVLKLREEGWEVLEMRYEVENIRLRARRLP